MIRFLVKIVKKNEDFQVRIEGNSVFVAEENFFVS